MSSEDFYLLISGMLAVDLVVVSVFLYLDKRRESKRSKDQREAKSRVWRLSAGGRESYRKRLDKLDLTIEHGRYPVALEAADELLVDVLAERGFPEEGLRSKRDKDDERARRMRLRVINPEAATAYTGVRRRRLVIRGARQEEEHLEDTVNGYRTACEALIGAEAGS